MNRNRLRRFLARRRGISTVELAIVLPLLLWLTFGVMEYGWMFLKMQEITNATRQGARVAARADSTAQDIDAAIRAALFASGLGDIDPAITFPDGDPWSVDSGSLFTVRVTVPYELLELGMPLVPTPANITSSISMIREGT